MADTVNCPTCGRATPNASFCQYCGKALYSCAICRTSLLKESVYCPRCGALVSKEKKELLSRERTSWAWWLLPLLTIPVGGLPWLGGLIAWAFNRNRNARKATMILWFSITLSVIIIVIFLVLYRHDLGTVFRLL
jgi:predicted nucleic acid-binding Zn ribbon protein